jgi:hypothetical protein
MRTVLSANSISLSSAPKCPAAKAIMRRLIVLAAS